MKPNNTFTYAAPALLVSFWYLDGFLKIRDKIQYRDWVLDSGAFSAHRSGVKINNKDFVKTAIELKRSDSTLTEVFALDVISDWKASLKNYEDALAMGLNAIPTYHAGEPESYLLHLAKASDKIAIGGGVGMRKAKKLEWARQVFKRVWPKKIHGFGFGMKDAILGLPFHSVDASNWEIQAVMFGNWKHFGRLAVRWSSQNLRREIEYYLDAERLARVKWSREMNLLGDPNAPTYRLAVVTDRLTRAV